MPAPDRGRWDAQVGRRSVLRAGAVVLASGVAGCDSGPSETLDVAVELTAPIERASVAAQLAVTVELQAAEGDDDALVDGLEVVLFDADQEPLGAATLGDYAWSDAPSADRSVEKSDSVLDGRSYVATFEERAIVEADTLPTFVGFRVDELRTISPPTTGVMYAKCLRYRGPDQVPATVAPEAYETVLVRAHGEPADDGGRVFIPPPVATATPTPSATDASTANETAAGTNTTKTGTATGTPTST